MDSSWRTPVICHLDLVGLFDRYESLLSSSLFDKEFMNCTLLPKYYTHRETISKSQAPLSHCSSKPNRSCPGPNPAKRDGLGGFPWPAAILRNEVRDMLPIDHS